VFIGDLDVGLWMGSNNDEFKTRKVIKGLTGNNKCGFG
jgi:hypothetical protein